MSFVPAHDLFSHLPIPDRAKDDLAHRMGEPSRHYHTLHHLDLLWTRHRRHRSSARRPDQRFDTPIALAIAYHDAIYVGGASDNEIRSAALWLEVGATVEGLGEDERLWVADTIRATADHVGAAASLDLTEPGRYARQWVLDLDLTPLGETPEIFDGNMALLAAEMPHLDDGQRRAALLAGLRHFARARPLYRCAAIATVFEEAAQENLRRHVGTTGDQLPHKPTTGGGARQR